MECQPRAWFQLFIMQNPDQFYHHYNIFAQATGKTTQNENPSKIATNKKISWNLKKSKLN